MNEVIPESEKTEQPRGDEKAIEPTLKLKFLSHGTLESRDLEFSRRFYEEFMGFEVIRTSKVSLWIRLGGNNIYAVVQVMEGQKGEMTFRHVQLLFLGRG